MNLETEVKYQVQTKAITVDEWFIMGDQFVDLESASRFLEHSKKLTGTDCRIVKLTTTKEVIG